MPFLPRKIVSKAPPVKTQGIKTKLAPTIAASVSWSGEGRWVEPFVGSAAVVLNLAPQRALLADTNIHIVAVLRDIYSGSMTPQTVRQHLSSEGAELEAEGERHYYYIRDRFNDAGCSHDFLFLSRSCFNGVMRFNKKGGFNVPFCRKPERFRSALITKIANQVEWAARQMYGKDWEFSTQDWRKTIVGARLGDMIYCDPPYVGRHTDYFNQFSDEDAEDLAAALVASSADWILSNWLENQHRRNSHIDRWFSEHARVEIDHFYHVGGSETNRGKMTEVLAMPHHVKASSLERTPDPLPLFATA